MSLSAKQQAFVEEYLVDLNGRQACIRAGYSARSAHVTSARLLSNASVREAIETARIERRNRLGIHADRVVEELRHIALADITNLISVKGGTVYIEDTDQLTPEQRAAVAEIAQTKDGVRVKFHSKVAALDALAKHLGLFAADKGEAGMTFSGPTTINLVPATREQRGDDDGSQSQ